MLAYTTVMEESRKRLSPDGSRTVECDAQLLKFTAAGPLAVERSVPVDREPTQTVVLLHGLAQNRWSWDLPGRSMVGALVEAGYEVLNVELRGHGQSRLFGSSSATAFADYVDDIRVLVAACERLPFLIGHSLGGAVSVGVACAQPVAGLIPLAGAFSFASHNWMLQGLARYTLLWRRPLQLLRPTVHTGSFGRLIGRYHRVTDRAGYGFPISGWAPRSMEIPLLQQRLAQGFDRTSAAIWIEMSEWATGTPFPYTEAFGRCEAPLLAMGADRDSLVHPEDVQACFDASGASDKQMMVFDKATTGHHWGHIDLVLGRDAPTVVWPAVIAWIDERS